jgi:hypothetical protein
LLKQNQELEELRARNDLLANRALAGPGHSMSEKEQRELLRLRGEVGLLRKDSQELAKLRMDRKTKALAGGSGPNPENTGMLEADAWSDVGLDTPEAALQTFFWAARHENAVLVGRLIRGQKDDSVPDFQGLDTLMESLIPGTLRYASELQECKFSPARTTTTTTCV